MLFSSHTRRCYWLALPFVERAQPASAAGKLEFRPTSDTVNALVEVVMFAHIA